jgi:transcriptional regulator
MKSQIVGFEIEISKPEGKFKLGQNRITEDRHGAIAGLRSRGQHLDIELAQLIVDMIRT